MIPKTLLQISKEPIPDYVKDMWQSRVDESWEIKEFDDAAIIEFFKSNPIEGFENIIDVFNSFTVGAHKADLFRYYYLYLYGGFYVDSDMMIHLHMNELNNMLYDHILIISDLPMHQETNPETIIRPPHIFNALIGCIPKSKILYEALKDLYNTKPRLLEQEYFYVIYKLYGITQQYKDNYTIKFYNELQNEDYMQATHTIDDNGLKIASHFYVNKIIPKNLRMTKLQDYIEVTAYFEKNPFQLFVHHPADDLIISKVICEEGHWEPGISKRILNGMTAGGLFLDIGANIGWHSKVAQDAGYDVICFEPQQQNYELLEKNCTKSGSILYKLGLGNFNAKRMIERDPINYGNSFISENGTDEITVAKLDDIFTDDIINRINVIKMDVQGFETEVLKGGSNFFKKLKPGTKLLLELSPTIKDIDLNYFMKFINNKKCEVITPDWIPKEHSNINYTISQIIRICFKLQVIGISREKFDQCGPAIDLEITL